MSMTLAALLLLAQDCAPGVAPETLLSVTKVESGFEPLAIGVNGKARRALRPPNKAAAVQQAAELIAGGANVDLGLGQINSRNLKWLGLTLEDAFDPCRNLAAAAKVLTTNYTGAASSREPQAALRAALSMYNTGDASRGLRNGYVSKVSAAAEYVVPALRTSRESSGSPARPADAEPIMLQAEQSPPAWDTFARRRAAPVMVFSGASHARASASHVLPTGESHAP